jgi:hypothetical protein
MVAVDDCLVYKKPKLGLNNAKCLRHYWRGKTNICACGCNVRVYVKSPAICLVELQEILNSLGYSISKNYKKRG